MMLRVWITGLALLMVLGVPPIPAGQWVDNFDDGDLHGWDIFNYDPRVERWHVEKGEAVGEIFEFGSMSLLVAGEATWHDYTVRCRAMFEKTTDGEGSLGVSLYESEHGDNRYAFFLNIGDGFMGIWRVEKNDWGVPVVTLIEVEKDQWYTIEAAVREDQLLFKVSDETDETILAALDRSGSLDPGRFALIVSDARAHFDDVTVEGEAIPDGGPSAGFAVAPQGKLASLWGALKRR